MNIIDEYNFIAGAFSECLQVIEIEGRFAFYHNGEKLITFDTYEDAKEFFDDCVGE